MKALRMLMVCAIVMGVSTGVFGSIVTFNLGVTFDGTAPAGSPPWLVAVFDDGGTPGSVNLNLTTPGLVGSEYVEQWLFNLDPQIAPWDLIFSPPTKTGSFQDPTIWAWPNFFKADDDGLYDIKIDFSTLFPLSDWVFGVGDSVSYTILGPGITANSFNFLSYPDGPKGPYPTAAEVKGIIPPGAPAASIDCAECGWITVPEPATMAIVFLGTLGMLSRRRRK